MNKPRATLIVPARNESETINSFLEKLFESVTLNVEVLIVVDSLDDTTIPAIPVLKFENMTFACVVNQMGAGPANAIRFGISKANAPVIVVTMADGSDDPSEIDGMIRLVERGCAMVVASRYMPGGQQIGGPRLKRLIFRLTQVAFCDFSEVLAFMMPQTLTELFPKNLPRKPILRAQMVLR